MEPMDLRDLKFITVDSPASKDLDDAITAHPTKNGWRVFVAIADLSELVPAGSELDTNAFKRRESKYFSNGTAHMLPNEISCSLASLTTESPKDALVYSINLDREGNITEINFQQQKVEIFKRLSYSDIDTILTNNEHSCSQVVSCCQRISELLLAKRRQRGGLAYYDLKSRIYMNEEGQWLPLTAAKANSGYILIQELMILANVAMAQYMAMNDIDCLYRNHEQKSNAPEVSELSDYIEASINDSNGFDPQRLQNRVAMIANKAQSSPTLKGHYGLNIDAYCHTTSPIRRYTDLVNQRMLIANIQGKSPPYDFEALNCIADNLNEAAQKDSEEKSKHFKDKALNEARHAIAIDKVKAMKTGELYSFVKYFSKSSDHLPEELERNWLGRLKVDFQAVLKTTGAIVNNYLKNLSEPGKERFCRLVLEKPFTAKTLLIHLQMKREWPEVKYETTQVNLTPPQWKGKVWFSDDDAHQLTRDYEGNSKDLSNLLACDLLMDTLGQSSYIGQTRVATLTVSTNHKGALAELAQKKLFTMPTYLTDSAPGGFISIVSFDMDGAEYSFRSDVKPTKKEAEQMAAEIALTSNDVSKKSCEAKKPAIPTTDKNAISLVQEYAQQNQVKHPNYQFIQREGEFHCNLDFLDKQFASIGKSKKEAKLAAAILAVNFIKG